MVKIVFLFCYLLNEYKLFLLSKRDENMGNFQDFYKMDKICTCLFPGFAIHILGFCCPLDHDADAGAGVGAVVAVAVVAAAALGDSQAAPRV
jgi:hypothetical protein